MNLSKRVRKNQKNALKNLFFFLQRVSEARVPTEYNRTPYRFQDPKSLKWFHLTIGVTLSSLDDFKKTAEAAPGIDGKLGQK